MNDPAEIGRRLGIPPCPNCGEPLGGRYGPGRVCWACTRTRPERKHRRRRPSGFETFHTRVWDRLELLTDSPIILIGTNRVACYCPRCLDGMMVVRIVDADRPGITITAGGRSGCSLGCSEWEISRVLFG